MQKRLKEKRMIGRKNIGRGPEHASTCACSYHERVNLLLQAPMKETTLPPTHYHQPILSCIMLLHATLNIYPACLATVTSAGSWELITVNMLGVVAGLQPILVVAPY